MNIQFFISIVSNVTPFFRLLFGTYRYLAGCRYMCAADYQQTLPVHFNWYVYQDAPANCLRLFLESLCAAMI